MKRGFPRPSTKVEKLTTWLMNDKEKEKWNNRSYPHPYSARDNDLAMLHDGRVRHCITQCMCIVCGDHVKPDKNGEVWVYSKDGRLFEDSGPFHEKCVRLTKTMCPVVNKGGHEFAQRKWSDVGPLIRGKHVFS